MDIDILLILQEFRNSIGDALTPFMEWLSLFAVTYLPVVPALTIILTISAAMDIQQKEGTVPAGIVLSVCQFQRSGQTDRVRLPAMDPR